MEQSGQEYHDTIKQSVHAFSEVAAEMLTTMFGAKCSVLPPQVLENGLSTDKNFFVSILFTGMAYGEYILASDEETIATILGQTMKGKEGVDLLEAQRELAEPFCELLNLTVGNSIVGLNQIYQKLTVTPPRVYFGTLSYPKIKMGKAVLQLENGRGAVECYLYVDRMQLDIASSYKEALSSVMAAHKELQSAMKRLQAQQTLLVQSEKMAALGTMAAGVAHEINTPLATVSLVGGQLKTLMTSQTDIDRASFLKMLAVIENTISRISRITNGMRIFANGVREERPSVNNVRQIIDSTLLVCEQHMKNEGISLTYQAPDSDPSMECRGPEMTQALLSIITNACEAVAKLPEKWIKIEVSETDPFIEIRVTDSGHGVRSDIQSKIFDPFFTTKDIGQGTGLGLSIAKGIVDQHGGEIGIDTRSPHTCFYIRIPRRQSQQMAS